MCDTPTHRIFVLLICVHVLSQNHPVFEKPSGLHLYKWESREVLKVLKAPITAPIYI